VTKRSLPLLDASTELIQLEPFVLPAAPFLPQDVAPLRVKTSELQGRSVLRTSSYTIYVDLPDNGEDMLIVQAYTGAFDLVSRRVATYLRSMEERVAPKPLYGDWTPEPSFEGEVPRPSGETIEILKKRGYLLTLTSEEEESLFSKLMSQAHFLRLRDMPSYVIMPTYECNLRCSYCFQDHMRTDSGYSHLLKFMDLGMVDRILAGMKTIEVAHGLDPHGDVGRNVTFFGGEPLLAASKHVVKHFIEQLRARGKLNAVAVTNATELDAYEDLLGPGKISSLQVTIDGPPAEHDRRRIYADGSGSFERIAQNLTMALERGANVNVRMNIDRNNIKLLPELCAEFSSRGWSKHERFNSYVAPIHAANGNVNPSETFNTWQLSRAMDNLRQLHPELSQISITDDSLQSSARQIFDKHSNGTDLASAYCGAHTTMYVIDAFADIYACWERTGDPKTRIGHIGESGNVAMNRALLDDWRGRNVVSNPVCRKCRYATSCGGGCAILAEAETGTLYKNFCDGYAQRFRDRVAKAYLSHLNGDKASAGISRLCET
jgi:uncharacterized protein